MINVFSFLSHVILILQQGNDFDFEFEPGIMAEWLLQCVGMSDDKKDNHLDSFFEKIKLFSANNPYPNENHTNKTSNMPITIRLYTPCVVSQEKKWEQKEFIWWIITFKQWKKNYSKKTFDHSKDSCKMMVQQRKDILW